MSTTIIDIITNAAAFELLWLLGLWLLKIKKHGHSSSPLPERRIKWAATPKRRIK
jgi:hypothetical protein